LIPPTKDNAMKYATEVLLASILPALLTGLPSVALSADEGLANPFFVLSNGVADDTRPTPDSQAKMLAELGCQGIGPSGSAGVPEMLAALDKHDLEMHALYIRVNLDSDQPPYEAELPDAIAALKGRETIIWLHFPSKQYKSPSSDGDPRAVEIIREIAQMAQRSGLRVALYPHAGFFVETVEDAVRVAKKVDRKNVGVCFNLCHWLKVGSDLEMKQLMELALPHLFLVTINGADSNPALDKGWDRLIQPLGQGSFDVCNFVETLHGLGFKGPVGLQCYAVKGDKYENLKGSMSAWKEISARIEASK
jgi:sugar phosphate isomerase/epimerase